MFKDSNRTWEEIRDAIKARMGNQTHDEDESDDLPEYAEENLQSLKLNLTEIGK